MARTSTLSKFVVIVIIRSRHNDFFGDGTKRKRGGVRGFCKGAGEGGVGVIRERQLSC